MDIRDEHDAFQTIIAGLKIAQSGCRELAKFRPDQRDLWLKMAEVMTVTQHSVYKIGEESTPRRIQQ